MKFCSFLAGATVYTAAALVLDRRGAKHRKRSGGQQSSVDEQGGSGLAIALGAPRDGIPESIVIGLCLLKGGAVSLVAVIDIFLSNLPKDLSRASSYEKSRYSAGYVCGIWTGIAVASGIAPRLSYVAFSDFSAWIVAATMAVAAGAMPPCHARRTIIPEAFATAHDFAGFITVARFLAAFARSKLGG